MRQPADNPGARQSPPRVGLFVTCLADTMRPRLGFAAVRLLKAAGCDVTVPRAQTCCGQPAFNSGDTIGAYHDSCSGLRELGVFAQPRALLQQVAGLEMRPLAGNDVCCGFGGTFCVKYPAISNAIVGEKAAAIEASGAALLLGGDLGCLMIMAGALHRRGSKMRAFHAAEILAGMGDGPAIGEEG